MFVRQQPLRKEIDMTKLRKLTLVTAAFSLATALFGAMQAAEAGRAGKDGTFCGNADVFVVYEEDAKGNPVPGTKEYGCTD
jgi:hypothetical protein